MSRGITQLFTPFFILFLASAPALAAVLDLTYEFKPLSLDLLGHYEPLKDAVISPDGHLIVTVSGKESTAIVWSALTGQKLFDLNHRKSINFVGFSPDASKIVTTSADETAKVWNRKNGNLLFVLPEHHSNVNSATFSPDGNKLITAAGTAQVWDMSDGSRLFTLSSAPVRSASFSDDGSKIVTAHYLFNSLARVWNAQTGEWLFNLPEHQGSVSSAYFNRDGNHMVTACDNAATKEKNVAKVWNAKTGEPLFDLIGHTADINSAHFNFDGNRIVTASHDGTAKIWETKSGVLLFDLKHGGKVLSASFDANGVKVVTASSDTTAKVWDATNGELLYTLAGHSDLVASAAFSVDGSKIVTASWDGSAKIWLLPPKELKPLSARPALKLSTYTALIKNFMLTNREKNYENFVNFLQEAPLKKQCDVKEFESNIFGELAINIQQYLRWLIPGRP